MSLINPFTIPQTYMYALQNTVSIAMLLNNEDYMKKLCLV